jgi:hypothetical protein
VTAAAEAPPVEVVETHVSSRGRVCRHKVRK